MADKINKKLIAIPICRQYCEHKCYWIETIPLRVVYARACQSTKFWK